ncbi:MAG TPA: hypothetical protein ENK10_05345 [Acidobacteria bacterium]|nr:hypothetical protein [Acidobacteriota bacterium]
MRSLKALITAIALLPAGSAAAHTDGGTAAQVLHLIYLHGQIVQLQQDARPEHPRFGHYELKKILTALDEAGFSVSAAIRPRETTIDQAAEQLVTEVRTLIDSGVPPQQILVVGASMGGAIALSAAARLQQPALRLAVLGVCPSRFAKRLAAAGKGSISGRILAIREASDEMTASCPSWTVESAQTDHLVVREIILHTGLHHGFLFKPLPEWVEPVSAWGHATSESGSCHQAHEEPGGHRR